MTVAGPLPEDPVKAVAPSEVIRLADDVFKDSAYAAVVLEVPSTIIVASTEGACALLDPDNLDVIGHSFEDFMADEPTGGIELFARGRLSGYEASRQLSSRPPDEPKVRMWVRTFDHQPPSTYVLVVMVAGAEPHARRRVRGARDPAAVVGMADASLLIERISGEAESMFGCSVADLLGRSLISLVVESDVPDCLSAIGDASATDAGINVHLRLQVGDNSARPGAATIGCEALILPLHPAPSCAFVLLPTHSRVARQTISEDLPTILRRLSRGIEVAELARGLIAGVSEKSVPGVNRLTTRELEIVELLLSGDRVPSISSQLFLSQSTVRNHLTAVFAKVGVGSQQELLHLFRAARLAAGRPPALDGTVEGGPNFGV